MNKTFTLLLIILFTNKVTGQGLISNWTFGENIQLECQDWYDGCGNELTISCDSFSSCQVRFLQIAPWLIMEDMWVLELVAGMTEGLTETYITGQSGTKVYELSYMMKSPGWNGSVSIGMLSQGQFTASKTLTDTTSTWKLFELVDTLTTLTTDTIVVRLSAGEGDFCICTSYFDLIMLTSYDPSVAIDEDGQYENRMIRVSPNPTSGVVSLEYSGNSQLKLKGVLVFNILGAAMQIKTLNDNELDLSKLKDGVYFLQIETEKGVVTRKVVKQSD